ncbi:MAG: right-handed parallel beta-helix repeat-containing protein [Paludibacteraceae bacterium]|nr:right-handed parallel beta-helix repeat-containing protein [Paludibacteraceae bacterium]
MKKIAYIFVSFALLLASCRSNRGEATLMQISFSVDTVRFDTVFTTVGSSTQRLTIRNEGKQSIVFERLALSDGENFSLNIDGEADPDRLRDIELAGKDSIFVFLKATIDPLDVNTPVFIEDKLQCVAGGEVKEVVIEAYGQNVEIWNKRTIRHDTILTATKPYLLFDTIIFAGNLKIDAGATFFCHTGCQLFCLGNVTAEGTLEQPITFRSDRTDRLFPKVPYQYVAGGWGSLFLLQQENSQQKNNYVFDYVNVLSGTTGLFAISYETNPDDFPELVVRNSRIHNHVAYGIVAQQVNAEIVNSEISNCGSYAVYLSSGHQRLIHNTIASFYRYTNINLQPTGREDVASLYISNLSKNRAYTNVECFNNIIVGVRKENIVVATPFIDSYLGSFSGNLVRTDTARIKPWADKNRFYPEDEDSVRLFKNDFYKYGEYVYYDFTLDSLSIAEGVADTVWSKQYPTDRLGRVRPKHASAGCYEYEYTEQ